MNKKMNPTLVRIINILNDGQYHDGDSIGLALNMTRSAVWKSIRKLMSYGVKIDSVKGRGYALLEPLVLLDAGVIREYLNHPDVELEVFESVDSTNDYLKRVKNKKAVRFCLSEQQTGGRGRLGREWYSPFGQNIYFSCLYSFNKDISELAGLSLVTGLAVLDAINAAADNKLSVKWPNDIICDGKKLAGCLVEIQAESHGACHAVIGVGVNVNMVCDEVDVIAQPWISLRKINRQYVDRNKISADLATSFITYFRKFEAQGFGAFIDEWTRSDGLIGREIAISNAGKKIEGTVMGINEQGHLLMRLPDGVIKAFASGDTTLRV